jgi:ProP effector
LVFIRPFLIHIPSILKSISDQFEFTDAQPDAQRHDIDGNPVGPVSDDDRLAAQTTVLSLKANSNPAPTAAAADIDTPKSSLIRAGIFGRNRVVPMIN